MFDTPQPGRTLRTLFGALVFVLGAQSMRFLFGSIAWYLRDTLGIGVLNLIPIALAPFVVAAVFPILTRWLSVNGALWIGVWLLAAARVVNQVALNPGIDFWAASVGTLAFVGLLPLMLSMGRSALVGGFLLGIAIDSAIRGMGLSLDLAYQAGLGALAGVVALCLGAVYTLWSCPPIERKGVGPVVGLILVGVGPWLFLQLLVLQNQGWISEVTGMGAGQAQLRIALLNVVALLAVAWLERRRVVAVVALVILVATAWAAEGSPLVLNLLSLAAIPSAGLVWAAMVPEPEERGLGSSATYLITGMTLFVALALAYYVALDRDLGLTSEQVRLGGAALLALFGAAGLLALPATRPGVSSQAWVFGALAAALPVLGLLFATRSVERAEAQLEPVRFLSYNIHSSFDTEGRFNIEEIAAVIEGTGATVVGLQEVPRGQLLSGTSDQLTILSQRLGFDHFEFFGTTDPTWGNAILSRYPIDAVEEVYLPLVGTPLQRGYLGATLLLDGRRLLFISTHLQHVNNASVHDEDPEGDLYPVHTEQIAAIVGQWDGREPAVMVGDFNARPEWRQISELIDAGWVDSWTEAGRGDGFTDNSADPRYRIDYIFHTPDLVATDAGVVFSRASDHLPVAADIAPR